MESEHIQQLTGSLGTASVAELGCMTTLSLRELLSSFFFISSFFPPIPLLLFSYLQLLWGPRHEDGGWWGRDLLAVFFWNLRGSSLRLCLPAECVLIHINTWCLLLCCLSQVVLFTYYYPDVLYMCCKPLQGINIYATVHSVWVLARSGYACGFFTG